MSAANHRRQAPSAATPVNTAELRPALEAGVAALGLSLDEAAIVRLLDFVALLQKWNGVYNLTAVRDSAGMMSHHILDSLAALPALQAYLQGRHVQVPLSAPLSSPKMLDVGSGGGLPAVVFAICCPQLLVDCVDAVAKKAAFIQQAAAQLGLANLRGMHARVQDVRGRYDVISSRAFASLADFTVWSAHALADDGCWLALKGKTPHEEMAALDARCARVLHVEPLTVPGLDAQRCVVWLQKAQSPTSA